MGWSWSLCVVRGMNRRVRNPLEAFGAHQAGNAFAAVPVALRRQFLLNAGHALPPPMLRMHGPDFLPQRGVGLCPLTGSGFDPGVVAAALDVKRRAELAQGMFGFHAFNGFVTLDDGSVTRPSVF